VLARPDFKDACARHDFGTMFLIMHEYKDQGWTFSHIGRRCEMSSSNIRTYTNGGRQPESVYVIERVSDGFHIPGDMLRIGRRPWEQEHAFANGYSRRITDLATSNPAPMTLQRPGSFRLISVDDRTLSDPDIAVMQAFRSADLQVGGGHLYASVIRYLHSDLAPRLFGSDGGSADDRVVFVAAAALTEMAGWMAHDAGRDSAAGHHFERSLALAEVAGDRQVSAHVLGSMSHLASHLGQSDKAIERARQGQAVLTGGPHIPDLAARLLALEARGFAGRKDNDSAECARLLSCAERTLGGSRVEPLSPWVSRFDEGSLASETARCMRQLGHLAEARSQAERIIALRPDNRTRSRAFGQLILVAVLVAQGKPDEACKVAHEVIASTQSLGSYLVIQQLFDLKRLLEPYRTIDTVTEFIDFLEVALSERKWLHQWLIRGDS
jgi:transcriptional regulator with XRE-family HTH domain